ncbi:hypothetical protein A500_02916 [Clostridium sartagoforme AAU1]|jgi:hypothetical protein|uniref:DUF2992 family protein n=1 Tax=Clostridium sartagoforme AAU1 TaxID=1202534 RepID=R9CEK8_9CLOT|nr:YjdF family protein [Clostridium sartagoforme]EOR27732.1 hypothetical protein A500_02916 [Clostridium sartagoforme AAU1]
MYANSKLTVFFEDPFWVGIFEKSEENYLCFCRIVFGPEPKDYEVYDFLLKEYNKCKFSPPLSDDKIEQRRINPKRLQKKIKKEVQEIQIGSKAQIAMKKQLEERKLERRKISKEKKEQEKDRQFLIRQQKKKEKHKGH